VTGGQGPRDWDKELAQIDKLIASGAAPQTPPAAAPPGAAAPAPRGRAAAPAPAAAAPRRAVLFTWVRLLLGLAVGVGITQWPYARGCGLLLFGYLGAVAGVIVAGLWSTVSSWRTRSALAHMLSLGLVFWGAILGAREVLPRVGYAKTGANWFCPAGGAVAPGPTTAPPAQTPASPAKPQGAF
jgi:hypothetical protein